MPKIIDRDKVRGELAVKAAEVFKKHGYSGLGMRQIAKELGMSKSALYHYFPSKEALFAACTERVTEQYTSLPEGRVGEQDVGVLFEQMAQIEPDFQGELSLIVDYLRGKSDEEVASDQNMQAANDAFLRMVSSVVGQEQAKPVVCLLYGLLLQRFFDGKQTPVEEVSSWLQGLLSAKEE